MEVHIGKSHTDNFECGLCEINFGNISKLETHLNTCEVYSCRKYNTKETKNSAIKEHVQKKNYNPHQTTLIDHMKICRNEQNEVSKKEHWLDSLKAFFSFL
jgi:4-diphosphocytidyl-2C-methyl-D-erythritol kinase